MRALIEEMPKQRPQPTGHSRSTALADWTTTSWKSMQAACTTFRALILFATKRRLHEHSSTHYLTQKNFRSECIALFAGRVSPPPEGQTSQEVVSHSEVAKKPQTPTATRQGVTAARRISLGIDGCCRGVATQGSASFGVQKGDTLQISFHGGLVVATGS